MPPSHLSQSAKPLSGRYLSFEEREEIALLRAQGRGIRHIACRLERAPSTISREVRRNAASRLPTATRGSNNSYTTSWDTTDCWCMIGLWSIGAPLNCISSDWI